MAGKVYTKTGDWGHTGIGVTRIPKSHPIVGLMGTLDELSAHLGLCQAKLVESKMDNEPCCEILRAAQTELYDMSGDIHKNLDADKLSASSQQSSGWWKFFYAPYCWVFPLQPAEVEQGHASRSAKTAARDSQAVRTLESSMDKMSRTLPKLTRFIRPGGAVVVSEIHICRTVCRRAERAFFEAKEVYNMEWDRLVSQIVYLNRLSDYLFVLARYVMSSLDLQEEYF